MAQEIVRAGEAGLRLTSEHWAGVSLGGLVKLQRLEGGWDALVDDLKALEERWVLQEFRKCFYLVKLQEVPVKIVCMSKMLCRVVAYGAEGLRGLEGRYAKLLAILGNGQWPTPRWPVYVFTAGAMVCLFTSSFCHLFGCCSLHFAKVRIQHHLLPDSSS